MVVGSRRGVRGAGGAESGENGRPAWGHDPRGGPGGQTTLISIFIYDRAFQFFEIGLGSAASVLLLGAVLGIGLVYVRLLRARI